MLLGVGMRAWLTSNRNLGEDFGKNSQGKRGDFSLKWGQKTIITCNVFSGPGTQSFMVKLIALISM